MGTKKQPFHEAVAHKLITQLKEGTAPWQTPWKPGSVANNMPFNPVTGKRYKGINALHLMSEMRSDQRWMTYKQAASIDAQVRRGESGTQIQYWKFNDEQASGDEQDRAVTDRVQLERPRLFLATVFNAEQIDGLPKLEPRAALDWDPVERAENILNGSRAPILHGEVDRAFYRPSTDSIHLPNRSHFPSADNYYAVALHELGHWTGHKSRLDRDMSHPFGSEGYAREELRAEIASMILGEQLGLGHDPAQHAAYVGIWIKVLQDHPLEIFRAAADAERIQEYVMGFEQKQVQEVASSVQAEGQGVINEAGNEYERVVRLARENEEQVRQRGDSTVEDLAAARTARKNAEFSATVNDGDLRRRIEVEEQRRDTRPGAQEKGEQDAQRESVLISVPYKDKSEAKALGAKWDRQKQSWYVPASVDIAPFAKWTAQKPGDSQASPGRTYIAVPYRERAQAKALGARWDSVAKSWYAGPDADLAQLNRWKPDSLVAHQDPMMSPREEFAAALQSIGCVLPAGGAHPIMDGKAHRVSVEGEKFSEHSGAGFYVGHTDGHPAGYMKNNRTGAEMTWKAKGYVLSPEQKAALAAEAGQKLQQRDTEHARRQEQAALRVGVELGRLVPVKSPTPYMLAKGILAHAGAMTDKDGKTTYLPAFDADGKHWTTQYIAEDGAKRFAKDSRKEGCFHVLGGMEELGRVPVMVIAEGYATAASLKEALGFATVAAFDAGNLTAVALALHERFPATPIVIAGDDDRALELTHGVNHGRNKAEEAARQVGGRVLMPVFAPGENSYPAGLPPVTPALYRDDQAAGGKLTDEQRDALARLKLFTDFNDLASRSILGRDGLERQVRSMIEPLREKLAVLLAEHENHRLERSGDSGREGGDVAYAEPKKRKMSLTAR